MNRCDGLGLPKRRRLFLRPPWRVPCAAAVLFLVTSLAYLAWRPGAAPRDGRHDLGRNAIWLGHAWLGDDAWYVRNGRQAQMPAHHDEARLRALAEKLRAHGIRDLYPHLCPAGRDGTLPGVNEAQTVRFLDNMEGFRVMPWIGGVFGESARIGDATWRGGFCASVADLLARHPRFAGVQVNVEPCPSGTESFLRLLEELRAVMPAGKILSVAAYPPPTRWQPADEVHWDEAYFREVARRVDQLAVMTYDTGIPWRKPYVRLMREWTGEVLAWSEGREVLFGLPAYDDAGSGWHKPEVENIETALAGIHAALLERGVSPADGYAGVAIYSEWEMSAAEWDRLRDLFLAPAGR